MYPMRARAATTAARSQELKIDIAGADRQSYCSERDLGGVWVVVVQKQGLGSCYITYILDQESKRTRTCRDMSWDDSLVAPLISVATRGTMNSYEDEHRRGESKPAYEQI
jgi:hypothetical protein